MGKKKASQVIIQDSHCVSGLMRWRLIARSGQAALRGRLASGAERRWEPRKRWEEWITTINKNEDWELWRIWAKKASQAPSMSLLLCATMLIFLSDGSLGENSWFPLLDQGEIFSLSEVCSSAYSFLLSLGLSDFSWWWESERAKASP